MNQENSDGYVLSGVATNRHRSLVQPVISC